MNEVIVRILAILLAAFSWSCSKKPVEVTGQIFVITQGRENIKMGGVEVLVVPDEEFRKRAKEVVTWMQQEAKAEAQRKVDSDHMTSFVNEVFAMEEFSKHTIPELPAIREEINKELIQASNVIKSQKVDLKTRAVNQFLTGLSNTQKVATDADGRFTIPVVGNTWFLAAANRHNGEDYEEYLWLKKFEAPIKESSATVLISNESDIDYEHEFYTVIAGLVEAPINLSEFRGVEVSSSIKQLVAKCRLAFDAALPMVIWVAKTELPSIVNAGKIGSIINIPISHELMLSMNWCPPGSFMMGSPSIENGRSSNEDQVQVTLSKGFWMGKTEVTQAQWKALMEDNPSRSKGDELPVENVSWDDVQEFIKKVNDSGILPIGWKMALPTEAQWEYACRAGTASIYAGEDLGALSWYRENSNDHTHPVASKSANTWGLYDMHGNVDEWCADWYDGLLLGGFDPKGPTMGSYRVCRGGSYLGAQNKSGSINSVRSADRNGVSSMYPKFLIGFRVTLTLDP
jgi:formylglycine-generating enzyme required for sulfatase activity